MDTRGNAEADALRGLALRLLTAASTARPTGDEPQLCVGQLPPDLLATVPLPAEGRVVGSHRDEQGTITILIDVDLPAHTVFVSFGEQLAAAGWTRVDGAPPPFRGFRTPPGSNPVERAGPGEPEGATYCRSAQGPALMVRVAALPDRRTEVRLRLVPGPGPCHNAWRHATAKVSQPLMPELVAPPGAELVPLMSGGSDDHARTMAQLVTDLPLPHVAAHFAGQLEAAGWERAGGEETTPYAWSTWIARRGEVPDRYRLLFISLVHYRGLSVREGWSAWCEHPQTAQLYLLDMRATWRSEIDGER